MIRGDMRMLRHNATMGPVVGPVVMRYRRPDPNYRLLFGKDRDYLVRWFIDALEDVLVLYQLKETDLANLHLQHMDLASRLLRSVGPMGAYVFNHSMVPEIVGNSPRPYFDLVRKMTESSMGPLSEVPLVLDEESIRLTPEEQEAFERVKAGLIKFSEALLGDDYSGIKKALLASEIGSDDILDEQMLIANVGAPPEGTGFLFYPWDNYQLPPFVRGKFFIGLKGDSRSAVFKEYALYLAGQEGLINDDQLSETRAQIPFALFRKIQLEILVSEFLLSHREAFGITDERETAFLMDFEIPRLIADLNHDLTGSLKVEKGGDFLSPVPRKTVKPLELKAPRLIDDPAQTDANRKAEELYWANVGNRNVSSPQKVLLDILKEDSNLPEGPALLIGAGDGAEALFLADPTRDGPRFSEIDALDSSVVAVNRMHKLVSRYPELSHIHPIHGDAGTYEFREEYYSRAISISLIGFLPADKRVSFLRRIATSLKPGGKATLTIDLAEGTAFQKNRAGAFRVEQTTIFSRRGKNHTIAKHFFTKDEMTALLRETGLFDHQKWDLKMTENAADGYEFVVLDLVRKGGNAATRKGLETMGSTTAHVVSDALLMDQPFVGAAGDVERQLDRRTMPAAVQQAVYGGVKLVSGGGGPFVRLVGSDEAGGDVDENAATGKEKKWTGRGIKPKPFSGGTATFPLSGSARPAVNIFR